MEMSTDLHTSSTWDSKRAIASCEEEGVKLFGVRLTDGLMMMRKAVSMGNLSCYNSASSAQAPQSTTPEYSESGDPHGYVSDGLVQNSGSLRERKKGVPWTEDEHRMFLVGLQKLGKGDWRGISRNFVPSRTPTQVASHAQKYFLRQSNLNKRKRRSSLFDIVSSNTVPSNNSSSNAPIELNPKLRFNLPPPLPTLDPPITSLESAPLSMTPLRSDCTSVSSDLRLGCAHDMHQKPQHRWLHTFSFHNQADIGGGGVQASSSTSECRQLLPHLSFMSERPSSERQITRSRDSVASSPTRASLTSLYRIDEATDLSANLRLSIGPPHLLEPMELSLKLEQPASRHSKAMAGADTNSNRLTNAIRVV